MPHARIAPLASDRRSLITAMQNVRLMHLLERLARRFNEAGVDLMVLKGAALNMLVYEQPDERSMCDLDLLVREDQMAQAFAVLEAAGCARSQTLVQDGFFPRFYYEAEFTSGATVPATMDLHIRPFRTLRYSRFVPDDGLWADSIEHRIGDAVVRVPSDEHMLLHLAVHFAIHGGSGSKWRTDLVRWIEQRGDRIDWDRLVRDAAAWRLALPLRLGIEAAERDHGQALISTNAWDRLRRCRANWRDRLAIAQAPKDNASPIRHVIVNALTTPGLRFVAAYLKAVVMPGEAHMREWYPHEHRGWLAAAHLLRWTQPITRPIRQLWDLRRGAKLERTLTGERTLVASRKLHPGQTIGGSLSLLSRKRLEPPAGARLRGMWRLLQVGQNPNVRLREGRLTATTMISRGSPLVLDPMDLPSESGDGLPDAGATREAA